MKMDAPGSMARLRVFWRRLSSSTSTNENIVPLVVETLSRHDVKALNAHVAAGHDLIVLDGNILAEKG